jgi:hypothetical protein
MASGGAASSNRIDVAWAEAVDAYEAAGVEDKQTLAEFVRARYADDSPLAHVVAPDLSPAILAAFRALRTAAPAAPYVQSFSAFLDAVPADVYDGEWLRGKPQSRRENAGYPLWGWGIWRPWVFVLGLGGLVALGVLAVAWLRQQRMYEHYADAHDAAVKAEKLPKDGEYTLLAYTDDAYDKLKAALGRDLTAEEQTQLVLAHTIAGKKTIEDLVAAGTATTLAGTTLEIRKNGKGAEIRLRGSTLTALVVSTADVVSSDNRVIHTVDGVLWSPTPAPRITELTAAAVKARGAQALLATARIADDHEEEEEEDEDGEEARAMLEKADRLLATLDATAKAKATAKNPVRARRAAAKAPPPPSRAVDPALLKEAEEIMKEIENGRAELSELALSDAAENQRQQDVRDLARSTAEFERIVESYRNVKFDSGGMLAEDEFARLAADTFGSSMESTFKTMRGNSMLVIPSVEKIKALRAAAPWASADKSARMRFVLSHLVVRDDVSGALKNMTGGPAPAGLKSLEFRAGSRFPVADFAAQM